MTLTFIAFINYYQEIWKKLNQYNLSIRLSSVHSIRLDKNYLSHTSSILIN